MEKEELLTEITADTVTLEVTDKKTGRVVRRELPIDFLETANCLRLRGENVDGAPSELVFFTDTGVRRLKDLTGKGFDHDPKDHHH